MAYITLNPVRAGIIVEPAEYRWGDYGERVAKGNLQECEMDLGKLMQRELGLPDQSLIGTEIEVMKRVWDRFRESLLGHYTRNRDMDAQTVAEKK